MYVPRMIAAWPAAETEGFTWKRYFIRAAGAPDGSAMSAAVDRLLAGNDHFEGLEPALDAGFCILHAGMDMDFVVIGFWINTNELVLRVYKSPPGRPDELKRDDANRSSLACVWDLAAIGHERDAWVKHVLTPETADRAGYLGDQLNGWK